jgi:hypothetical protein
LRRSVRTLLFCLAFTPVAFAAVRHTKAQQAYFDEHEKCVTQLREAKKAVRGKPTGQRKAALAAARREYDRCEAWAQLVWKYYPQRPPAKASRGEGVSGPSDGTQKAETHPPQ